MLNKKEFQRRLENELSSRMTLDHPILAEMSKPKRNMELLRLMALQGYQLTKMFAKYIGGLYYYCPVEKFSRRLALNLYEEETGKISKTDGHLQLMQKFIYALGVSRKELEAATPLPETTELIEYRRLLVESREDFHMAAAAVMIASEGQNLEKKAGKMRHELLPQVYGLSQDDLLFFVVHAAEDIGHVKDGLELVSLVCDTEEKQQDAIRAIHETCDRFWGFYNGIQRAYESQGLLIA
ncbi:MAG TPA: iron-containing redox enzyme family protein [Blastocatellia bacterium]|nr:iron-containing redox enzyme family protein [Blastocatellia bacterium]